MDEQNDFQAARPLESAARAEQFSIWAMRLWWGGFPELDTAWPDLVRGFKVCGVPAALESLHRFCSIALSAAGCGSGIACIHCPRITAVEEKLLDALAAAQRCDSIELECRLREFMPASAARLATAHAQRYAQALTTGGLEWRATVFDFDAAPASQRLH